MYFKLYIMQSSSNISEKKDEGEEGYMKSMKFQWIQRNEFFVGMRKIAITKIAVFMGFLEAGFESNQWSVKNKVKLIKHFYSTTKKFKINKQWTCKN